MSKRLIAILLLLLIGGTLFLLQKRNSSLRGEILALERRVVELQGQAPEVARPVVISTELESAGKLELMRLRAEVTELRKQVREFSAGRDRGRTGSRSSEVEFAAPIPVENWVRSGDATPADAAQSLVNYLYKLNTSTNESEITTNHPPLIISYFPGSNSEAFTNTTALTTGLLERAGEIVSFQTGPAKPGVGRNGEKDQDRMVYKEVPVRINYADGTSHILDITFESRATVENGQLNPVGSWGPLITFEIVDGKERATF